MFTAIYIEHFSLHQIDLKLMTLYKIGVCNITFYKKSSLVITHDLFSCLLHGPGPSFNPSFYSLVYAFIYASF